MRPGSWARYAAEMEGAFPGMLFRMRETMHDALVEQRIRYEGNIRRVVEVICDKWHEVCRLSAGGY